MADPIAVAFVLVRPDTTGFAATLQAELKKQLLQAQASVKPIVIPVVAGGGAAASSGAGSVQASVASQAALASEITATATAAGVATRATVSLATAQAAVDRANLELLRSTAALNTAQSAEVVDSQAVTIALARQAAATSGVALANERLTFASAGLAAEQAGLGGVGRAAATAESGILASAGANNILRGSLIGLARVTPVAVFGLGVYGTAAIAAGLAVTKAIGSAADFEQQLNTFQAVTGATANQMREVADTAKQLGSDLSLPATSASDAALALTELAKAGLSVEDALAGAKGVLQLGTAANISAGEAANIVATELNAFSLSGTQAVHVADLLAGAANAAQGEIADFGIAFQQVAAVAFQVNLSIEQTTGALTELARAGLKGADGGTSLRTMLLRLVPTTKEAAAFQHALGIEFDNTRSAGEQLPHLLDQYRHALSLLTPAQQQLVLTQIFGQDAIRAASILIRGGSDALNESTAAANKAGEAQKVAEAKTKGLSGAYAGLKSNLETLGITLGTAVIPPLTTFTNDVSAVVGVVTKGVTAIADLGHQGGFLGDSLHKVGVATKEVAKLQAPFIGEIEKLRVAVDGARSAWNFLTGAEDNAGEAAKRNAAAIATAAQVARESIDETARVGSAVTVAGGVDEDVQQAARSADHTTEEERLQRQKVRDAQLKKQIIDMNARRKAINDALAPRNLRDPLLQAQLSGDLNAELAGDRAIEDFFQKRLDSAEKGTARYTKILGSLQTAHAASQAVLDQINQEAKSASDKQAAALKEATSQAASALREELSDREAALQLQIEINDSVVALGDKQTQVVLDGVNAGLKIKGNIDILHRKAVQNADGSVSTVRTISIGTDAGEVLIPTVIGGKVVSNKAAIQHFIQTNENFGTFASVATANLYAERLHQEQAGLLVRQNADQQLLALLREESHDSRLTAGERIEAASKLRDLIVTQAKAEIDLRNAKLDLAIQTAQTLTPNDASDDKVAIQNRLNAMDQQINGILKIKNRTTAQEAALVELQSARLSLQATLNDAAGGGGFSLSDLFAEAVKQLNQFGSNVSGSVITGGGARAAVAGAILSQAPQDRSDVVGRVIAQKSDKQIAEAARSNQLLKQILDAVSGPSGSGADLVPPAGFATAVHARQLTNVTGF